MSRDLDLFQHCYFNSTDVINPILGSVINQVVLDIIGSVGLITAVLLYSTVIPTLVQFFRFGYCRI